MNVVNHQSWIIFIFVLFSGVHTISVVIEGNEEGLIGDNGTEIECSYTRKQISQVYFVSFMAFNRSSTSVDQIATYIPDQIPLLLPKGQYLKGRVTLTTITQLSTKAVMTFNKLMCIDNTFYQCTVSYLGSNGNQNQISNNISISVQVPPSKPDSVLLVHTPADSSVTTTKHMDYSSSSPSTAVTSKEHETSTAEQNTTTAFNHSTIQTTHHNTTSSTPSNDNFSSKISYRTTTYSTQQTTTEQVIAEGNNITVVCTGDVGKPPAKHFFQKYRDGHTIPLNYTATETSIYEISENCSYYRTSNLTFQVTAKDNNAVIRCVVNSSMTEPYMYIEMKILKVYSDISTTQSSSTGSSSGADVRKENSTGKTVITGVFVVLGISVIIGIIVFGVYKWRKRMDKPYTDNIEYKSFIGSKSKSIAESRTGNYDFIDLEDANKTQSVDNGFEAEDIREHNKEYLKKQENDEQKKIKSNGPTQPAVYAQVNEATKSRNKQITETPECADKQEEDTYAETQEGIYDKAGDRRHKENENVEHFDTSNNSSKQNSNGDTKLSIQTSQIGSFVNKAFEKDESCKVATVSPTVHSSGSSQDDKQTKQSRNSQSKIGYENIKGTDETGTSGEDSSHQTAW